MRGGDGGSDAGRGQRATSQHLNRKLYLVADEVTHTGPLPDTER
ncbi:hypothetical protein [Plantactinospora endophytica]|uniref:Transposase n=1 Tax=Plantactinospora endophytica TaxID=673535 RepID=A0ABQ4E3H4_9ACTN|nr:hypothetical protein [Plantactinospora endophytica]GIG89263.1 hypothetical protein Pen02_41990 [Plantactinospora endophytica]